METFSALLVLLWRGSTGHWWILLTKACDWRRHRTYIDVTVMDISTFKTDIRFLFALNNSHLSNRSEGNYRWNTHNLTYSGADILLYSLWCPLLPCFNHYSSDARWASYQIRQIAGAHALGMPGTFSPSPQVSDPDMHHGTCVTHVPWCMPGSLTRSFLWNRRRGKTFPAFPAHAQPAILRIW